MAQRMVKSAERVLLLLEYFATKQSPATVMELSRDLGFPQPSVTFLVKTLVEMGYLIFDPVTRTYLPSMRVALLGTWIRRRFPEAGKLPKLIQKLSEETGESVVLAMRAGIYAQYIFAQGAESPLRLEVQTGSMRPLACSAAGWALLQFLPDSEIELIARRTEAEAPIALWRNSAKHALANVERTRTQHFAFTKGQTRMGKGGIGIALPPLEGSPQFAISVGGQIERIEASADAIVRSIRKTIDSIMDSSETELQQLRDAKIEFDQSKQKMFQLPQN